MTATSPAASPTTILTARLTARPVVPAALSLAALEAAVDDARVVTGDDGLDHYL